MDQLKRIENDFRDLGDQLEKYAARCTKPPHLGKHISDMWITAGRLLVEAIDLRAFPKSLAEQNRGWWDRSIGRIPGGPVAVYGSIPQALLKAASFKPQGEVGAEFVAVNTPDPAAVNQYPIDAAKPFTAEQYSKCWVFAFGSWLTKMFPERFRHKAASWDWWCAKQDELGRLVDKHGKPLKGHWYRDGELLPANFKWSPDCPGGHYHWKLDAEAAGTTDFYSEEDWMEHQRVRAEEHAKACRLAAQLIHDSIKATALMTSVVVDQAVTRTLEPYEHAVKDSREFAGYATSTASVIEGSDAYLDLIHLFKRFWQGKNIGLTESALLAAWKVVDRMHTDDLVAAARLRHIDPTGLLRFSATPCNEYATDAEATVRHLFIAGAMEMNELSDSTKEPGRSNPPGCRRVVNEVVELKFHPDKGDLQILNALRIGNRAMLIHDVAIAIKRDRGWVGERLSVMEQDGIVAHPPHKKRPYVLTPKGAAMLTGKAST